MRYSFLITDLMLLAIFLGGLVLNVGTATVAEPSFDCNKAAGSIEEMICADDNLSALDRKLAEVYTAAALKAVGEHPPVLQAEQRGWIKGRKDC